jgi:hypothetical protein
MNLYDRRAVSHRRQLARDNQVTLHTGECRV